MDLTLRSRQGRIVLMAVTLSAGAVFLDGTIVNVATVAIQGDLGATFGTLQWIVSGYLLTLGSLVLVGGSLGDLLGRRSVYLAGVLGFALASVVCGLAVSGPVLVGARIVQGIFAAIVAPSGLAILNASFARSERARAIGLWTAWGSVATALGPFLGGFLVDSGPAGWRLAFLINVPLMAVAYWGGAVAVPRLPGRLDRAKPLLAQFDLVGSVLVTVSLGLFAYPLIEWNQLARPTSAVLLMAAVVMFVLFIRHEAAAPSPMMPLDLWRDRDFSVLNAMTFLMYGEFLAWIFLLAIVVQRSLGYSALEAGLSLFPMTVLLAALSPVVARVMPRVGGWRLLVAGAILSGIGVLLLLAVQPGASYWTAVFPGVLVHSAGFVLIVVPITAMTLAAAPEDRTGIAAGLSNANARIAGLVTVAALPLIAGIATTEFPTPDVLVDGFRVVVLVCAAMCGAAALLGLKSLSRPVPGQ